MLRVEPSGSLNSKIAFVGEAPGYEEEKLGRPFVGRSGTLLVDKMQQNGIHRKYSYMTNVIKEKPYKNNIKPFINIHDKGVDLSSKAEQYISELKEELELCEANVIVAVGNIALYALTGQTGITKYRGSILESTLVPGRKVIPIVHPAAALREHILSHLISMDLKRIALEAQHPDIRYRKRDYIIRPSFQEVMDYFPLLRNAETVGFDIEVQNYEVSCISFAPHEESAICIPFVEGANSYFTPPEEAEIWVEIAKLLENRNIKKIAQNAIFDTSFIFDRYGIVTNNCEDTMVAQAILYPEFPKGLDFLTSMYTDIPYYKDDGKFKNPKVSDEAYWLYNAKDSIVLPEIFRQQVEDLKRLENLETYQEQVKLLQPLVYMMTHGIRIDPELKKQKAIEADKRLEEINKEINEIAGQQLNPRSPAQLKEYFYAKKKYKPYVDKGKPTTNEKALKQLAATHGDKVAKLCLEHRSVAKASSSYYHMLLDKDNRMRTSFNPVGTQTGRLSSKKTIVGTGGNLQNLPKDAKEYLLPDEGYICYEVDLSQAENRLVAYLAPEPKMIDAFENGKDIHSLTASMIFGGEPTKAFQGSTKAPIGDGTKDQRFWGKTSNHSLNYDLGAMNFSRRFEIPLNDAKEIRGSYHRIYPGVKKYHLWVQDSLHQSRTITNLFGRTFYLMDRWGDELFKKAYAYLPQSTVADIINRWGINYIWMNPIFEDFELLNQVHDSIVFQIPKSKRLSDHARIILALCRSLEQELTWHGRTFSIPASLTINRTSFADGVEIGQVTGFTVDQLAREIHNNI